MNLRISEFLVIFKELSTVDVYSLRAWLKNQLASSRRTLNALTLLDHGGVQVPGDVPPARVYFFELLVWTRVYFLAISIQFSLGKGMPFGNFGKRNIKIR